jgi:Tfp pilus assembly protein PilN
MKAVNLLPTDLRGAPKKASGGKPAAETPVGVGAYIVLGVLAMAVAALAVFVLAGNAVKDREAKLATVKAEAQNAQQRAVALKPYADFEALVTQRETTVGSLAGARFDWHRALEDLSRALPEDAALSEISGNVTPETAGAGGASPLRNALPAPAISMKGCVSSQTGVARVMSRLRAITGVTRVTLSNSSKDGTSPGAGSAGTGGSGPYCGKGTPPTFDLVVFFERDAARVASAPGMSNDPSAAAGVAAAAASVSQTGSGSAPSPSTAAPGTPATPATPGSTTTSASTQGGGSK